MLKSLILAISNGSTPTFDGQITILAADIKVAFNFLQFPWFQLFLAAVRHEMEKQ